MHIQISARSDNIHNRGQLRDIDDYPLSLPQPVDQHSPAFLSLINRYKKEEWPVQLLHSDYASAVLLQENMVFAGMKFYGHKWQWHPTRGLLLPVQIPTNDQLNNISSSTTVAEHNHYTQMVAWNDIKPHLKYVNAPTWKPFDGVYYGPYGLNLHSELKLTILDSENQELTNTTEISTTDTDNDHSWNWDKLTPSYYYQDQPVGATECYIDIISSSWEHEGEQGFGMFAGPHGHSMIEFCDEQGRLFSVGQYPSPIDHSITNNHLKYVYGTASGVFVSPDPYMTSSGEKTVHRYLLGSGEIGARNIDKIKKQVELIKSLGVHHNACTYNCSDFAQYMEDFAVRECENATLVSIHSQSRIAGNRRLMNMKRTHEQGITGSLAAIACGGYNYIMLLLVNLLLTLMFYLPVIGVKLGRGHSDVKIADSITTQQQDETSNKHYHYGVLRRRELHIPFLPNWPRRLRTVQKFSSKYRQCSGSWIS